MTAPDPLLDLNPQAISKKQRQGPEKAVWEMPYGKVSIGKTARQTP
jgi:hypothetical protein